MAKVVGDIAVTVGADVSPLRKGMDKAGRSVKSFGRDSEAMGKKFAKVGVGIAVAAAAASAALLKLAAESGKVGAEISNLSKMAGIGTTEFQRYAAGAQTVGIEQDKLADILKDVNDKVGDFMSTGAGPMADFFENIGPLVGVTAENFRNLSGPDALQLYVSSLEKAGASQQDMTFYMEALASDATALLPLLRDNGAELERLGTAAQQTGRVLSEETVAGAQKLNDKLRELREETRNEVITALVSLEDELQVLADFVKEHGVPALEALIKFASNAATKFGDLKETIKSLGGNPRFFDELGNEYDQYNNLIASPNATVGTPLVDDGNLLPPPLKITNMGDGKLPPRLPIGGGGAKSGRDFDEEMEALQAQFATEYEVIQAEFAKQLAQLAEFRAAKVSTEEEYNALEAQIRQEHADKMVAIERAATAAKLAAISGAFGDLSSLMSSENKKMFKIGQAAAIAESTISGYQAAVTAWEKGMKVGGPGMAAAFSAASLVKTGALISSIASQSPTGGGGGGGGASVGGGSASAPPVNTSPNVALQLVGGDMYGRDQVISLINAINEAQEDGAIVRLV